MDDLRCQQNKNNCSSDWQKQRPRQKKLTPREREVMRLVAQGLSNREVGEQLSLAMGTVKWSLHNIYEKLDVSNRAQAVWFVLNRQPDVLYDPDDERQPMGDAESISRRRRQILKLVADGLSNRDIAETIFLSEATIKWHLYHLFRLLGVRSRSQAILKGKDLGLLV